MNAPCNHKEAVCVIGNYWQCSVCENPGRVTVNSTRVRELVDKLEFQLWKAPPVEVEPVGWYVPVRSGPAPWGPADVEKIKQTVRMLNERFPSKSR